MALFTEASVRQRAQAEVRKSGTVKKASQIVLEACASYTPSKTYDIFLSHSIRDAELILGMKGILEDLGYTVYVDWIEDPQMDRSTVTAKTADKLRQRMNSSKSLFFVTTSNAESSRWMPWECGFFDGKKEKVAIVPIQATSTSNSYSGQEYLGLYPYVVKQPDENRKETLWVRKSSSRYISYDEWVSTPNSHISWREG
ncbi:toll/interleukin-1 receptor domain-containing protein [Chromobacterium sp. IIBBL 290-4]|uniref:toll/interleukin-1 receptor domain-containing protein n=1 Tax=Chromobacterium sp. IIBBL 290-4 TaxID=2953890 RepID=UPI0020B6A4DC|nr:toll/interleukin-1 receptor domain-containing protein [Chromobacterium sp. IIBBL 290-4]UTH74219.1 toll/interleukin-1 receptor domain-containing protein [Chromobacterium sp. IIBBL 290-4]